MSNQLECTLQQGQVKLLTADKFITGRGWGIPHQSLEPF
jgi:hypothetical protein